MFNVEIHLCEVVPLGVNGEEAAKGKILPIARKGVEVDVSTVKVETWILGGKLGQEGDGSGTYPIQSARARDDLGHRGQRTLCDTDSPEVSGREIEEV